MVRTLNTATLRRPKFDLRFITETSEYHIVSDSKTPDNNYMTESVISMTTKNSMSDDSSAFSFVLAGDVQWEKILNSNDMVILKVQPNELFPGQPSREDKVKNDTLIVGLISEVRIEGNYGENSKLYRITGQSLAKAFIQFELRTIQQVSIVIDGSGWMDFGGGDSATFSGNLMGKNVADTVNVMLDRFMEYMHYYFNRNSADNTMLQTRIERVISSWENDELLTDPIAFTNYEGSFNQLLRDIVNRPFCEMFFDVYSDDEGNEKAKFIVRRTPFDKEDWNALPRHELHVRDVIEESVGQSDLDAYAIFNVIPENNIEASLSAFSKPKFHPSLVEKYGYKMLEVSHKYLATANMFDETNPDEEVVAEENDSAASTSLVSTYSERLYNWYAQNPNFFSGEITVIGHPDYRLGNRLFYTDEFNNDMWEYYIESVEHTFSYTDGFQTNLGVTRGLKLPSPDSDGGRFDAPMGPAQDFEGGYMGEMSLAEIEAMNEAAKNADGSGGGTSTGGTGTVSGDPSTAAKAAADFGLRFINNASGQTAYHWGGGRQNTNPLTGSPPYKLDCSSYVFWCYNYAGITLRDGPTSHWTGSFLTDPQLEVIGGIGSGLKPNSLTYGDIVFFNGDQHVGLYVGNGEFIGFNGSGYNNFEKGCEKKSMTTGYWSTKFQGHVLRLKGNKKKSGNLEQE